MKNASLLFTLLLLPALACSSTATSAPIKASNAILSHPEGMETCVVTAVLALNIRAGPDTSHAVIGTLEHGDILTILPHPAPNNWIPVRAQELEGWVHSNYCKRTSLP